MVPRAGNGQAFLVREVRVGEDRHEDVCAVRNARGKSVHGFGLSEKWAVSRGEVGGSGLWLWSTRCANSR